MAGLSGFAYYKEITIDNTNVNADIDNFPVYVPIVDDTDIGGHCVGTNGYDVQFANSDNSATLPFERIYWNNPAGTANGDFYVLVNVKTASSVVIRCYYGKSGESDLSSPTTVFDTANGWVAVWHLEENSTAVRYDATTNNHDSTSVEGDPDSVAAKSANGNDFIPNESITVGDSALLDIGTDDFTISFICKSDTVADARGVIDKWTGSGAGYRARNYAGGGAMAFTISDALDNSCTVYTGAFLVDTWYHCAFVCDRSETNGLVPYQGGVPSGDPATPTAVGALTNALDAIIGGGQSSVRWDGIIDELRISNTLRSAAWIKLEKLNIDDGHAAGNELNWDTEQATIGEPIYLTWTK